MTRARKLADFRCIENLLNCYCREIAGPAGELSFNLQSQGASHAGATLTIVFPAVRATLVAEVSPPTATRSFEYHGPCKIEHENDKFSSPWQADWHDVANLIIGEIAARHGKPAHPELLTLIADSVVVAERIASHPERLITTFIESEQGLTFGHPYHPSPKSRAGFSGADLERFSPELGARFALHYFAVRRELVLQDSLGHGSCGELICAQTPSADHLGDDFVLVPTHPWQANYVRRYEQVRLGLARGELLDLGLGGPQYFATSSVRTLYAPGLPYFLKTSLNMRITNCLRRNALHELQSSLLISKAMQKLAPELRELFPAFHALSEPAYLTVDLPSGGAEERERIQESFGLMLRDAMPLNRAQANGITPIVAAAFFGNRGAGRAQALHTISPDNRGEWFSAYARRLAHPMLHCFFEQGIMFEPHLQNIVIGFGQAGMPEEIYLRDFDNGKLIEDWFPRRALSDAPKIVRDELLYEAAPAWKRFVYCLVVNNFAEVIAILADSNAKLEQELWQRLFDTLSAYQLQLGDARSRDFVGELLAGNNLPAKGNLLTRVFKRPDRKAEYFGVPNPLNACRARTELAIAEARAQ